MKQANILCIRFSSLGDILLTLPALQLLREEMPGIRITYLTKEAFAPILQNHPHIDDLILLKKKEPIRQLKNRLANQYDVIIDWHNSFRSRILRWQLQAKRKLVFKKPYWRRFILVRFQHDTLGKWPAVYQRYGLMLEQLGISYRETGGQLTQGKMPVQVAGDRLILFAPGANWFTKRWPAEKFQKLGTELISRGYQIGFIGSEFESKIVESIVNTWPNEAYNNYCGKVKLNDLPYLMKYSKAVISNDSALLHMAAIAGVPVIGIFLSTTKSLGFTPPGETFTRVEAKDVACRPCSHIGLKSCPKEHFNCAENIEPQKVLEIVLNKIGHQ